MKTYTVKQVAEKLNINPETVRRWIRDGKLEANQMSKKTGNVIMEGSLNAFLSTMPKYANKTTLLVGGVVVAGGLLADTLLKIKEVNNSSIDTESLKNFISNEIIMHQKSIQNKKELIKQANKEISDSQATINSLEELLNQIDVLNIHKKNYRRISDE